MTLERLKILQVKTSINIHEMKGKFDDYTYKSQDQNFGFFSTNIDDNDTIKSNYTEKVVTSNETYDPYGNFLEEVSFISFKNITFHIEKLIGDKYLLIIHYPPKSLKSFLENLSSIFNFKIGFSNLEINLVEFKNNLEETYKSKLSGTSKVKVSRLIIDKSSRATIEVSSIKDALESLDYLVKEKNYQLDKLSSSINISGSTIDFEISKSCNLKIHEDNSRYILKSIKNTLTREYCD